MAEKGGARKEETCEWGSRRQEAKERSILVEEEEEVEEGEENAWQRSLRRYRRRGRRWRKMRRTGRRRVMTSSLALVALASLHPETSSWAER